MRPDRQMKPVFLIFVAMAIVGIVGIFSISILFPDVIQNGQRGQGSGHEGAFIVKPAIIQLKPTVSSIIHVNQTADLNGNLENSQQSWVDKFGNMAPFNASGNDVVIETVNLTYEGIDRVNGS